MQVKIHLVVHIVPLGCKVIENWPDLLTNTGLEGIIIATPPHTHFKIAAEAIKAGIPVLVEKPLTVSLSEAKELVQLATDHNVLTMVGHTLLFSSAFRELKNRGQFLGKLKKINSVSGNWGPFRIDTPPLWDWAPHDIAMSIEIAGSYPTDIKVQRVGSIKQSQGIGEAIKIMLNFSSGACAEILVSNILKNKQREFAAEYENGTMIYNDLAQNKLVSRVPSEAIAQPVSVEQSLPLTNQVSEFTQAIGEGKRHDKSLQLGLQVIEVLNDCQIKLGMENDSG